MADTSMEVLLVDDERHRRDFLRLAVRARVRERGRCRRSAHQPHRKRLEVRAAFAHRYIDRTGCDRIVIAIADRGPGMSTDEQRNAFERSDRGETRGEVSGSGLGLAIAKRAIERGRGTIRLRSVPSLGKTFTLELPEMPISVGISRTARFAHR